MMDHQDQDDSVVPPSLDAGPTSEQPIGGLEHPGSGDSRIKRRAKRVTRQSSQEAVPNGAASAQCAITKILKNSRRPLNGYGRGLPKKGGAGGKGVWGTPGSELLEADVEMEDPNYDSDSLDDNVELKSVVPVPPDEEIRRSVDSVVLEYFEHGDTAEAALSFDELNCGPKRYMIPMLAIETALSHKPSHREMTSRLISDLYGRVVKQRDIARAFELLLENLPDLSLDTPDAASLLGNFVARAVADDCLPPRFVAGCRERAETDGARVALARADTLLSMKHGLVRLDNVWGVGGGLRPVKYLVRQMTLLLREYLSSGDLQEATRCLLALEVPHFHHELVYEAVVMTLEAISAPTEEAMARLLKSLSDAVIITPDMMDNGLLRVYEDMPDICLDVPLAFTVLERFLVRCHALGFVSAPMLAKMPGRGRKRFVSEGDGGRVKTHDLK